jgi:hypothetical protein
LYEREAGVVRPSGDLARLYTDYFEGKVEGAARGRAIELLRRGSDGNWRLIVGDPRARG